VKEFRWFALEGVADELENPSNYEQPESVQPEGMEEDAGDENWRRKNDEGNAERVAQAVDGMLVAARVLRDPLFAGAVAKHYVEMIHRLGCPYAAVEASAFRVVAS
jgi:hypothetical protein